MKRAVAVVLTLMLSLCSCGGQPVNKESEPSASLEPPASYDAQGLDNNQSAKTGTPHSDSSVSYGGSFDDPAVSNDVDDTVSALDMGWKQLSAEVNTYEKYLENTDKVEAFYDNLLEETTLLCIGMREYSLNYAEVALASDKPNDDKYKDLEEIYDSIYDDAGDDIYDEIYDGILDEMYDVLYDGILDDAYDNAPYSEWSDARSDEYKWWSDTRSDAYEEWSDFRSGVYAFWSELRSKLWSDDVEEAGKAISDFREDIAKLGGGGRLNHSGTTESANAHTTEPITASLSERLADGMRPDFKAAMDSYEAFCDEYCDFMEEYKDNPSDSKLLVEYGEIIVNLTDMNTKFEAWESGDLNDAELKCYLEVNNRITQKLLEIAQ